MTTTASSTDHQSCSTTTIFSVRDYHVLEINGYSRSLKATTVHFDSPRFRAGGRSWYMSYRPRGTNGNSDSISLFLVLDDTLDEGAAMVKYTFSLLDQDKNPVPPYYATTSETINFSADRRIRGAESYIKREILESSACLKDDCFSLRVQIHLVKETPSWTVPPSDMRQHIASLLLSMEGADVEFRVGGRTFFAHRLVLAARSPVFKAQLYGPMKEGVVTNAIQIEGMEAQVFKAMLDFVYTDSLPEMEQEDEPAMTQHLLVAADMYLLQRLKLVCEVRLCKHIDAGSVPIILAIAEKHSCSRLKEACFKFIMSSTDPLAVVDAEEFEYLSQSCPAVREELNAIVLARHLEEAKISETTDTGN